MVWTGLALVAFAFETHNIAYQHVDFAFLGG
jgi:hypothetical protein